jgi:3-methyl-2-oxobutanoate hydroxymethyltransferase
VKDKVTIHTLRKMKQAGQKIGMLTAYDATFARIFDAAGADVLLVGDSLGMVVQGHDSTLPVTLDEMIYHTRAVARGVTRAHVVATCPS